MIQKNKEERKSSEWEKGRKVGEGRGNIYCIIVKKRQAEIHTLEAA